MTKAVSVHNIWIVPIDILHAFGYLQIEIPFPKNLKQVLSNLQNREAFLTYIDLQAIESFWCHKQKLMKSAISSLYY